MQLTEALKIQIDNKSVEQLLHGIRFAPTGSAMFQGESGAYWLKRYDRLRNENPAAAVQASKDIGW